MRQRLLALAGLRRLRFPELALTAYLPVERGVGHNYYRDLLVDLRRAEFHKLDEREQDALDREIAFTLPRLEKQRFESPSIAVFSSSTEDYFGIWRLPERVVARMAIADTLDLAPIRLQLRRHPPTLVAVVDKREARVFSLVLAEVDEVRSFRGLPISRHEQGGWSADIYQRRQDDHTTWNLRRVVEAVEPLIGRNRYRRLVVAGSPEARSEFIRLLSPPARSRLAATGSIAEFMTGNELDEAIRALAAASQAVGA